MAHGSSTWQERLRGKFLVFDGPDGSGKSTQFARFARHCREHGVTVCEVREPGGTAIGEQIRDVLLDPQNTEMSLRCEMMLYMASRSQLIVEKITPALQRGELVLADRFISSTLSYQGTAGGMKPEDIIAVGRVAIGEHWPDVTIIFDVDEKTAAHRMNPLLDRMERKGAAFHKRVREGYLEQARQSPGKYLVIDATREADEVFAELLDGLAGRFARTASRT